MRDRSALGDDHGRQRYAHAVLHGKDAGLGFAIPYHHNGRDTDYVPDFIVRLREEPALHLILETKGYDPMQDVKLAAAERWCSAVNADGRHGVWRYAMVKDPSAISDVLSRSISED